MNKFEGKTENNPERERFEKIAVLIRHPSTQIDKLVSKGDDDTPWDDLEDKVGIERGKGHDMAKQISEYLVQVIPDIVRSEKGPRSYKFISSPLRRARALAKYELLHIEDAHKDNQDLPLPDSDEVEVLEEFSEIPMSYSKGKILEMATKVKKEGKPTMATMEEWFKSDPDFITSIFEGERQRVLNGLEKIKSGTTSISLVNTHRLVTGFILWLIENGKENEPVTTNDLPKIMEIARNLPYTSLSEIGWNGSNWNVYRKGDTPHLSDDLIGGKF